WGLPEAQPLKDSITRYRPDISSEGLEELFFQLYLFYFQTVKQVLGESEPPLWLQRYREELKRLRLRLNPITIPPQTVHVWPWSSSMAIYGGAFRPNCIEPIDLGAELYNRRRRKKRFKVNILEADDTVLGFIYTKGALLDGARVLILGMEPRATWRFSPKKLLAAVIEKYAVIAAEAGYEKLLFCSEEDQKHRLVDITDNRDLMEAVRSAVREGQLRLWKSRQKLKGPVIDGNNFFVIWEREK
ncbi:MAG: hypothetical protein U1D33_00920, partial [bacterium]|nr:hypothetical protein [bacterium]